MNEAVQNFIAMCEWDQASFLIFSDNVFGNLIYYSHGLAFVLALLIGLFVLWKGKNSLLNKILFFIMLSFSVWSLFDLILWATERPDLVMFFWSALMIIEPLIYALSVYFLYVFIRKRDIKLRKKFLIFLPLLPIIVLLPTSLTIVGFDLTNCFRVVEEGFIATYYVYAIEILYALWILGVAIKRHWLAGKEMKHQIALMTVGLLLFLLSFISGNIIGSATDNWTLAQIGLFSLPIFAVFIAYMIVRFKSFNIKAFGAQVLMLAIGVLVLGLVFIRSIENVRLVAGITLVLIVVAGNLLIRGVRREIEQKEKLTKLNQDLRHVIKQRESLVHLITHKVKGSFTRTKYIFAEMLAESFGPLNDELKVIAQKGLDSDAAGIQTIDLVLNASNLESGIVKYEMKKLDFGALVRQVVEEKEEQAQEKGLELSANISKNSLMVLADEFWLKEVVNNLIDNSIKYTPTGSIRLTLTKKDEKVLLVVKDTGVGISEDDMEKLFTQGGRGKEALKMNVDSTGYGLYSVKLIIDAHGGHVWAESEGKEKGSAFFVEIDSV